MPRSNDLSAPPQRWISTTAVIRNEAGAVLLLKPHHAGWQLPGGVARAGEMPHAALTREVREATGLHVESVRLLAVDHVRANPHNDATEGLELVYDGGVVEAAAPLLLREEEWSGRAWVTLADLKDRVRPFKEHRIRAAVASLDAGATVYLVQGEEVATPRR